MGKNFVFVDDLSPQDIEADVASQKLRLRRVAGTTPLATSDKVLVRQGGDLVEVPSSEFDELPPYTVADAGKKLAINDAGNALEWKGITPLLVQLAPVLENTIFTPPATPNAGDSYIVAPVATGDWLGHEDKIATWDGLAWAYYTPACNDNTTVQTGANAGKVYKWDCTLAVPAWTETVATPLPATVEGIVFSSGSTIESEGGGVFIHKGDVYGWGKLGLGLNGTTLENSIHSIVPSKYDMAGNLTTYSPVFVDVWYNTQNIFALDDKGFLWASGRNTTRQLGDTAQLEAANLSNLTLIPFFKTNNIKIKSVSIPVGAAGTMPVAAITESGDLYLWGHNAHGQLGQGNTTDVITPTLINFGGVKVKSVQFASEQGYSTYAAMVDGALQVCGRNGNGQLGLGNVAQRTTFIQSNTNVKQVATGTTYALVVKNDGTAQGCGVNTYGQLGQGNTIQQNSWVALKKAASTPVTAIDKVAINAGNQAECAFLITDSRKILVAGRNANYQLGINNVTQQNYYVEPTLAQAPFQGLVQDAVLAGNLTGVNYVLTTTGEVWSAGYNIHGQRGLGHVTAATVANGLGMWRKANYPNPVLAIRGMGLDDNSTGACSIYALDVEGGIYTHGYRELIATDGIVTSEVYSPMLAPTPYKLAGVLDAVAMVGATALVAGQSGTVPSPLVGDMDKFLAGDGTWKNPPATVPVPGPVQTSVVAKVFNVSQGTVMSFDNLKLTLSGNNCQIATAVGAENVAILSEHEYPGGSSAAHTGGVGTPLSVTTTLQNVGDTGFVAGERAMLTIANLTTGKLYRACVWMHSAVGGKWSGWVEEI